MIQFDSIAKQINSEITQLEQKMLNCNASAMADMKSIEKETKLLKSIYKNILDLQIFYKKKEMASK
jgi:hypothetical protein